MSRIGSCLNRSNSPDHYSADPKQNHAETKNLADYVTPAQQRALEKNDAESLQLADDEALAWAIQASLNEQTERLPLQSQIPSNAIAQQIADDEVLARAIEASEKEEKKPSTTSGGITSELLRAQRKISNTLHNWFNQNGYRIVPNSGKNNNCLLISLLQHATGDYKSQHSEKAAYYKSILEVQSKGDIGRLDPLYSDTPIITELIQRIGQDHGREMSVNFYFADAEGNLAERTVGSGNNKFSVFDQAGHFEAVLPPFAKI